MKTIKKTYEGLKEQYPDAMLLFRCGDIYKAYYNDAVECSNILGTVLLNEKGNRQMTGFTFRNLDRYLPILVRAGKRVALCNDIKSF